MNIIKAVSADIEDIMSLIKQAVDNLQKNGIDQWDTFYPNKEIITNDIAAASLFKIVVEKNIAGVIVLNGQQPLEYQRLPWKNFQGQGLAKELMHFAEKYAAKNNYTSIRLDAFQDNRRSLELYHSLDYRLAGTVNFRKGTFNCYEKTVLKILQL
jgi:RimJ/RimL family protein N-acetyltransferase